MDYKQWVRKFKKELAHELEKETTAEIDDNIMNGFVKPELHWKPLSEKYKKRKEKEGRNLRGLIYHGTMLKATDSKVSISKDKITIHIKNNAYYSGFHEYGTKKMPARQFVKPAIEYTLRNINKIAENVLRKM